MCEPCLLLKFRQSHYVHALSNYAGQASHLGILVKEQVMFLYFYKCNRESFRNF